MYVHLAIHRPHPDKARDLIESMHRYGASVHGQPGLIRSFTLRDADTGDLVGLSLWATKEAWEAARPAMIEAVKDDPFGEWEDEEPRVLHLDVV